MSIEPHDPSGDYSPEAVEAHVLSLEDEREKRERAKRTAAASAVLVVDVARAETPPIRSYRSGNMQLDNLLGGGINTRELCVVMGPPGGCKTAWAISTALEMEPQLPQLYASTELERHELMARVAAWRMRRSWAGIRRGTVDRESLVASLEGLNLYVIGSDVLPRDSVAALALIKREAERVRDAHQVAPAIFVDYLQDLARGADREVRTQVGDIATDLRRIAQDLDCAVIAVSSVARTFYSMAKAKQFREADDSTVYLAAAKESGDVDYAAARVLFLDAEDDRDKASRAVRIAVAKSRDARTGFAGARVISECGRFEFAPEVLSAMATTGQAVEQTLTASNDDDEVLFRRVVREHAEGHGASCTKRYLRVGNKSGNKPLGKERAEAALERLLTAGRLRLVPMERPEGGKMKVRELYSPATKEGE